LKRIKLTFAGLTIEFTDRSRALERVEEWVEGVISQPIVVYGPEGCGKSAWLRQVAELLRELGFEVLYLDLLHRDLVAYSDVKELVERLYAALTDVTGFPELKLAMLLVDVAKQLIGKWGKKRLALLLDEVFQAIGLERAELYVKSLLSLIEYPPGEYEKILVLVATSEGLTRSRIGRHMWADVLAMWNMSRSGFIELYEKIPGSKPTVDYAWRLSGGNPRILGQFYRLQWSLDAVVEWFLRTTKLEYFIRSLSSTEREWLLEAIGDPDSLFHRDKLPLLSKLVELNLVVDTLPPRTLANWVDEPPPERDLDIGVGVGVAWQTPIHREAVKRILYKYG
jgi:dephospho-CoA kinase